MDVFWGNMSDSVTMRENLDGFKKEYGVEKTVVVADKGMNYSHNIDLLCSQGDGYVFSQILKGTKGKRYHKELFSPEGWHASKDGSYKWELAEEEYTGYDIHFEMQDGEETEKNRVKRKRKVLLYWSRADAQMAAQKREERLARARKSTKNNSYSIAHVKDRYIMEQQSQRKQGRYWGRDRLQKYRKWTNKKQNRMRNLTDTLQLSQVK